MKRTASKPKAKRTPQQVLRFVMTSAVIIFILGTLLGFIVGRAVYAKQQEPQQEQVQPLPEQRSEKTVQAEQVTTQEAENPLPVITSGENVLSSGLYKTMIEMCDKYGAPLALVLAVAEHESRFNPDAVSSTNDYGIMQINKINHSWLRNRGIDPMSHKGNIEAGCLMISDAVNKYGDYHKALMAYNCGDGGANKLWKQGIYNTHYSRQVMELYNKWNSFLGGV